MRRSTGAACTEIAGGALEALLDRFLADEKGASNLRVAEAAKCFQRESNLVFARQARMAAREDHAQLAILDLRVEKEVVDPFLMHRSRGGPFVGGAAPDSVSA